MRRLFICLLVVVMACSMLLALTGCNNNDYTFTAYDWDTVSTSQRANINIEGVLASGNQPTEDNYNYNGEAYLLTDGQSITFTFNSQVTDDLALEVDYFVLHNGLRDTELAVTLNSIEYGSRCPVKALWANATENFSSDNLGNEIVPTQSVIGKWVSTKLYNYDYKTVLPVVYPFVEGTNTLTLTASGGDVLIGSVSAVSSVLPQSYESYIVDKPETFGCEAYTVECEHFYAKNSTQIIPAFSADVNVTPYTTHSSLLNTAGGMSDSTHELQYKIVAPSDGRYNLAFNYNNSTANRTAFVSVTIDGEAPFRELLNVPLVNNGAYSQITLGGEEPYDIWLTEGEHIVTIRLDSSLFATQSTELEQNIDKLNEIYLSLKKIAGTIQDKNREWNPDTDYPGVVEALQSASATIKRIAEELKVINGSDANYQAVIYLQTAHVAIDNLLEKPQFIANNYAKLSEGSGSIVQTLANAKSDIDATPISLDKIAIFPSNCDDPNFETKSGFYSFWEGVKKFFRSFVTDYSNVTDDENTIQVWVARSRQYVDLMQQMIDESDFEQRTGYNVRFSILADEGKLILSNAANISPNAVMGISNWLPYEMGIRDLTVDLTQFDDYGEVISRFSEGAMISLIADGRGLALPETQDFYVMYYRKDILEDYNLKIPNTWDEVIAMLPQLQRYGLNFYVPLSSSTSTKSIMTTAPFIYQYGGTLFSDDATSTTIADEQSLDAIKLMTELYTLYSLPQQVNNFFDSFRNGSLPIGISTFDTYIRLSIAAPEIAGRWGIALSPGVTNENGEIERWQTGSASSMTLMKSGSEQKDSAGWELLKWWSSAEVQTEFMNKLTMLYGKSYIWNSANVEAFGNSVAFTEADKKIILEQWTWLREIPKVPGWYMLERELSNAWNSVVLQGENTRSVIENAVTTIDRELERKLTEFGYMEDGKIVKEYKLTTLEYVRELKGR